MAPTVSGIGREAHGGTPAVHSADEYGNRRILHALDVLLQAEGDDQSAAEARALIARITEAVPDAALRQRFHESDIVQRVRKL